MHPYPPPGHPAHGYPPSPPQRPQPGPGPEQVDLFGLLGLGAPDRIDLRHAWRERADGHLRVPFGLDDQQRPTWFDLAECGFGLAIHGAPGTGKSELLRTIMVGLAATHSPQAVAFGWLGHRDSRWFHGVDALAHAVPAFRSARDIGDSLREELNRRMALFNTAAVRSFGEYEQKRRAGVGLAPLPALVLAADDLDETLRARPEVTDIVVLLTRTGFLGCPLLYTATDRAALGKVDAARSDRIVLRTTAADSTALVGDARASELPSTPGRGFHLPLSQGGAATPFHAARTYQYSDEVLLRRAARHRPGTGT